MTNSTDFTKLDRAIKSKGALPEPRNRRRNPPADLVKLAPRIRTLMEQDLSYSQIYDFFIKYNIKMSRKKASFASQCSRDREALELVDL